MKASCCVDSVGVIGGMTHHVTRVQGFITMDGSWINAADCWSTVIAISNW